MSFADGETKAGDQGISKGGTEKESKRTPLHATPSSSLRAVPATTAPLDFGVGTESGGYVPVEFTFGFPELEPQAGDGAKRRKSANTTFERIDQIGTVRSCSWWLDHVMLQCEYVSGDRKGKRKANATTRPSARRDEYEQKRPPGAIATGQTEAESKRKKPAPLLRPELDGALSRAVRKGQWCGCSSIFVMT